MKKIILGFLSIVALGAFMVASIAEPSFSALNAEDHTHSYVSGLCSCGTRVFECEDGLIEGQMSGDPLVDKFINNVDSSDNPAHAVSGTGFVEYMAVAGNSITWKFNLDQKLENVKSHFWISTGQTNKLTSDLAVTVNGVRGKWETSTVQEKGSNIWFYFLDCEIYLNFAEGNNTLKLTNTNGASFNFDCLEVEMPVGVTYGPYDNTQPDGEMPVNPPTGSGGVVVPPDNALDPISSPKTLTMEAEYLYEVQGTNGSGQDTFFANDDNASGGGIVTNFGHVGDNIAVFKFEADKAVSAATITVSLGTSESSRDWVRIFIPRINGGSGGATPFNQNIIPGVQGIDISNLGINNATNSINVYTPVTLIETVQLNQGENIFEIECWQGILFNIDYVEITTTEDVIFTYTPMDHGVGGKGGAASLEAEVGSVKGTSADPANEVFVLENAATGERATSNDKYIGNFGVAGNQIKLAFRSNLAVNDATFTLYVAGQGVGGLVKDIITMTLNGEAIVFNNETIPAGTKETIVWTGITIPNVQVNAGVNKIILTNVTGEDFLIDNIYIDVPDYVNISTNNLDRLAPTIGMITFVTEGIRTQKEVEFTFDYSDDFSEKEELKVVVSVYYNFGKPNQAKIAVSDNKMTPNYLGDYTISVSITDLADNTTTRRRILNVKYGENKVEEAVKYVDKKEIGGWVTFGVGMTAAIGMVGYMVIASKKRA